MRVWSGWWQQIRPSIKEILQVRQCSINWRYNQIPALSETLNIFSCMTFNSLVSLYLSLPRCSRLVSGFPWPVFYHFSLSDSAPGTLSSLVFLEYTKTSGPFFFLFFFTFFKWIYISISIPLKNSSMVRIVINKIFLREFIIYLLKGDNNFSDTFLSHRCSLGAQGCARDIMGFNKSLWGDKILEVTKTNI